MLTRLKARCARGESWRKPGLTAKGAGPWVGRVRAEGGAVGRTEPATGAGPGRAGPGRAGPPRASGAGAVPLRPALSPRRREACGGDADASACGRECVRASARGLGGGAEGRGPGAAEARGRGAAGARGALGSRRPGRSGHAVAQAARPGPSGRAWVSARAGRRRLVVAPWLGRPLLAPGGPLTAVTPGARPPAGVRPRAGCLPAVRSPKQGGVGLRVSCKPHPRWCGACCLQAPGALVVSTRSLGGVTPREGAAARAAQVV